MSNIDDAISCLKGIQRKTTSIKKKQQIKKQIEDLRSLDPKYKK